jgi:hypothetical protein
MHGRMGERGHRWRSITALQASVLLHVIGMDASALVVSRPAVVARIIGSWRRSSFCARMMRVGDSTVAACSTMHGRMGERGHRWRSIGLGRHEKLREGCELRLRRSNLRACGTRCGRDMLWDTAEPSRSSQGRRLSGLRLSRGWSPLITHATRRRTMLTHCLEGRCDSIRSQRETERRDHGASW